MLNRRCPFALTKKDDCLRARVARPIVEVDHSSIEIYSSLNTYWISAQASMANPRCCLCLHVSPDHPIPYDNTRISSNRSNPCRAGHSEGPERQRSFSYEHVPVMNSLSSATQVDVLRSDNLAWANDQELQLSKTLNSPRILSRSTEIPGRNSIQAPCSFADGSSSA